MNLHFSKFKRVPLKVLTRCYIFISIIATTAVVQSVAFPRWPTVQNIDDTKVFNRLSQSDLQPVTHRKLPATRSHELATSPRLVYLLEDGFELSILKAKVRQRMNLNIKFITQDFPSIKLNKLLENNMMPISTYGHVMNKPAVQTCYIKANDYFDGFGTQSIGLSKLADRRVGGSAATLYQLIGLRPNRSYECILISLISKTGQPITTTKWQHILYVLSLSK